MEVYCNTCCEKKPMKRIRKPKNTRYFVPLFLVLMIVSALLLKSWPLTLLSLIVSLILAVFGKNYWECESCGELTERI
jgi:glucose-6-phosphate-specific signal transduction histidine kinase